jgi:hypothetical protein
MDINCNSTRGMYGAREVAIASRKIEKRTLWINPL